MTSVQLTLEQVVPEMIGELESDAQIIVVLSVVMRTATYVSRRTLAWDGVKRRERGAHAMSSMEGSLPAGSLMTAIFEPSGERVFMGYGGLDLIFELNLRAKKYDLREDIFEDEDNLLEGICTSFHPYFGNEDDC